MFANEYQILFKLISKNKRRISLSDPDKNPSPYFSTYQKIGLPSVSPHTGHLYSPSPSGTIRLLQ